MENKLAENIRIYRKNMGLSQEQLAERLGITLGTISKWERGASEPDLLYVMQIAELFHVSVDALIGFTMHGNNAETEVERLKAFYKEHTIEETAKEYDIEVHTLEEAVKSAVGKKRRSDERENKSKV